MGQKVHPTGIRLGIVKDHNSVWYADSKAYSKNLINDIEVREYILKKLDAASVVSLAFAIRNLDRNMAGAFKNSVSAAFRPRAKTLHRKTFVDVNSRHR